MIYIVRHGQTEQNLKKRMQGRSDFPLTELGREQLHDVVARVGEFLERLKAEAVNRDILLSTHAIAMKGLLEYLTPESNGAYWSRYIGNCAVYVTELNDGTYSVPTEWSE